MAEKRHGYSMGIYFSGGGGHALGFWRSGESTGLLSRFSGHTYFFDPQCRLLQRRQLRVPELAGRHPERRISNV